MHTWKIGLSFAASNSARSLLSGSDVFVLSGAGYLNQSGQYAISSRIATLAVSPALAVSYAQGTSVFRAAKDGYLPVWHILKRQLPLFMLYGTVVTALGWICAPIVVLILGPDFALVSVIFPLLTVSAVFLSIVTFVSQALVGLGRLWFRTSSQIAVGVLALTLNLTLVPKGGWLAAVWVSVGTSALLAIVLCVEFGLGVLRDKRSRSK
jgi:O-antigen/teichoic acid export membrane protein